MLTLRNTVSDRKSQLEYFRLRGRIARAVPTWAKANGLGAEYRLLQQIIAGSASSMPWSWKILKDQAHSAEKLGFSVRTFERHLSVLRAKGILIGHHTIHRKHEVPTFSVSRETLEALVLSAKLADSDIPFWRIEEEPEPTENPMVPGQNDVPEKSAEYKTYTESPNGASVKTKLPEGSRRLRRRCLKHPGRTEMNRVAVLGVDPEVHSSHPAHGTPASRLAKHFESEWDRTRRAVPAAVAMELPAKPWPMNGKSWCLKWLKTTLLPAAGSVARAEEIITRFCDAIIQRWLDSPPSGKPVFNHLGRHFDEFNEQPRPVLVADNFVGNGGRPKWAKV